MLLLSGVDVAAAAAVLVGVAEVDNEKWPFGDPPDMVKRIQKKLKQGCR